MILRIASISGVTFPPGATTMPCASGLTSTLTCRSASKVGSHTILPRPPYMRCIHSTALGLMPPTALLSTIPPQTSIPGTTFMTSAARSAVVVTWFFSTMPRMPLDLASCAMSMSSMLRPKTSGCECTWKSITPAAGLTRGGGGGKPACANACEARAEAMRPAARSVLFIRVPSLEDRWKSYPRRPALEIGRPQVVGRLLERVRRAQREILAVRCRDELQSNRQSVFREAARHRQRRLLGEVERVAERRPPGPVVFRPRRRFGRDAPHRERRHGERRSREQVPLDVELAHALADRGARCDRVLEHGERMA